MMLPRGWVADNQPVGRCSVTPDCSFWVGSDAALAAIAITSADAVFGLFRHLVLGRARRARQTVSTPPEGERQRHHTEPGRHVRTHDQAHVEAGCSTRARTWPDQRSWSPPSPSNRARRARSTQAVAAHTSSAACSPIRAGAPWRRRAHRGWQAVPGPGAGGLTPRSLGLRPALVDRLPGRGDHHRRRPVFSNHLGWRQLDEVPRQCLTWPEPLPAVLCGHHSTQTRSPDHD